MPLVLSKEKHEEKSKYLKDLFSKTYITDVIERKKITNDQMILEDLLNIISSVLALLLTLQNYQITLEVWNKYQLVQQQLEIDFVANKGSRRYYIQSALSVGDEEKRKQEVNSLNRVADSYKKVVVVKDDIIPWHDDKGILYIGIEQFLLEEGAMDL